MTAFASLTPGHSSDVERDPEDVVYRSERTLVVRRHSTDGSPSVIVKQAIGAEALRRLRHEQTILRRLGSVDGVVRPVPGQWGDDVLVLVDHAGVSLAETTAKETLSLDELLAIALKLARTLAEVHRKGIVHRDINPSNIILSGRGRRPLLIDFNIAAMLTDGSVVLGDGGNFAGTLAFMPPEQTGRTGRPVDQRSDLYAFGAVLYQMLTGRTLFETEDLLDILHHQLTTVPKAPKQLAPATPTLLSELVMRLLDKEPDRRYQSADGVAHDLERLIEAHARGDDDVCFALGERDFAPRLLPPSRLVGREQELNTLRAALAQAADGVARVVRVEGAAGVGKTALAEQLRTEVIERRGWFVSGEFAQRARDAASATVQALRELGRLLLSRPEAELQAQRERMTAMLGSYIDAGVTRMPEYQLLLGSHPTPAEADPLQAEKRMLRGAVAVIRSVASKERPLVMLLDNAQWAPDISTRFVDAVLEAREELPGFLLVLAHRPAAEAAPLQNGVARWARREDAMRSLLLPELTAPQVSELVGAMLRLGPSDAHRLGALLGEREQGNPQGTIELINALRQDGLLIPGAMGWHWEDQAIRRYVGENDGVDLLARRLAKLPTRCLSVMNTMIFLGGDVPLALLEAASGTTIGDVRTALTPALDDGLIVLNEVGDGAVLRWRANRVQECVQQQLGETSTRMMRLAVARRLAKVPAYWREAAHQYVETLDDLNDPVEQRQVAALLRNAAQSAQVANADACERLAAAAAQILRSIEAPEDAVLMRTVLMQRHLALYSLGRLETADAVYDDIVSRTRDPYELAEPAGVQIYSLCNRGRAAEALEMGLRVLAQLGVHKPDNLQAAIAEGLQQLAAWAADDGKQSEFQRPEVNDAHVLTLAKFMKRLLIPAFSQDKAAQTWLQLECHRLWVIHGPSAAVMAAIASGVPMMLAVALKDFRSAQAGVQHLIAIGEDRHYEHATATARLFATVSTMPWMQPTEDLLPMAYRARAGLLKAGDVLHTSYTYTPAIHALIDCGRTLDAAAREIEEAIEFDRRYGNPAYIPVTQAYRQFVRALSGGTRSPGSFNDDEFDEEAFVAQKYAFATAPAFFQAMRALSALIFNDERALHRHASVAHSIRALTPGFYISSVMWFAHGMSLAAQVRAVRAEGGDAAGELREGLDEVCGWMAERAVDAPANFAGLAHLLAAERAWAFGDEWDAAGSFERALVDIARRPRPWQHALINERAARFYFAQNLDHVAKPLLTQALHGYEDWGAVGKVRALLAEFQFLRNAVKGARRDGYSGRSTSVSSDAIDTMAILRASQALSSETSLTNLNACVEKVLGAMCGATSVLLVVQSPQARGWRLASSPDGTPISVDQAGERGLLALSAFRYAERTREPLLLEDATRDARFAADPALAGLGHCSLLLVPIMKQGALQAVLILENRMRHSAFTADRLDAVKLIAGQLAVSLDNALLYATLESKVAERTAALEEANRKLEQLSVTDALTGLANRRQFDQALQVEWYRAKRAGTSVGLAMIDIDQFKQYNDHYGHAGGDACLQLVADAMRLGLRTGGDLLARYGGEEFVLLLRDSDLEGARICAERVRAAVAAHLAPHAQSVHGIVTISVGVAACVPTSAVTVEQCLEQADAALYEAKRAGRNRVAVAEGIVSQGS